MGSERWILLFANDNEHEQEQEEMLSDRFS